MKCRLCDGEYGENPYVNKDDETLCNQCHMAIYGRYGRCGHSLAGVNDGPCSGLNQTHFCKPDPYNECLRAARAAEEKGKLTPAHEKIFKQMLAEHKKANYKKVDYQKDGHPIYDRN